jgi:ADP-ribose 1''-phosphate phosphatase
MILLRTHVSSCLDKKLEPVATAPNNRLISLRPPHDCIIMSKLVYVTGDLFAAPQGSILVHACNTVGSWGAGIALAFRSKYPQAFQQYAAHCKDHDADDLIGSSLLIPGEPHDIACLFTSRAYGKRKDTPEEILDATRTAVRDLLRQNKERKPLHAWYVK